VGGYGVRPIHVAQAGEDEWQTNFKLPPGLTPGWHEVRMRIGGSHPGSAQRIAVDVPLVTGEIQIDGLCDGTTWEKNRLDRSRGDVLSFWASGLPENVDCGNLRVTLDGQRLTVTYIEGVQEDARQINVKVPKDLPSGPAAISVSVGNSNAADASVEIVSASVETVRNDAGESEKKQSDQADPVRSFHFNSAIVVDRNGRRTGSAGNDIHESEAVFQNSARIARSSSRAIRRSRRFEWKRRCWAQVRLDFRRVQAGPLERGCGIALIFERGVIRTKRVATSMPLIGVLVTKSLRGHNVRQRRGRAHADRARLRVAPQRAAKRPRTQPDDGNLCTLPCFPVRSPPLLERPAP
jgi:hypothetical protein